MTPTLILLAAVATIGTAPMAASSIDYIAQMRGAESAAAVAPAETIPLTDFGIAKIVCIHTPGYDDRQTCEGTATKLPALVPGANTIPLPIPVRAYVVRDADTIRAVEIDLHHYFEPSVAVEADALGSELLRQLNLATRCEMDADVSALWRAGPAFVASLGVDFDRLVFLTADTEIEFGQQSIFSIGRVEWRTPRTYRPTLTAGDCMTRGVKQ